MGNQILLFAAILSGACSILSFMPTSFKPIKKTIPILWCLSAIMIIFAVVLMIALQVLCKFQYQYVYDHISKDMGLIYKVSALWSGQEGSFLLWALIMGIMSFFVLRMKGDNTYKAFGIYSAISSCVYIMCFIVHPFNRMNIIPLDGLGITEALKNPWMVIHPPLVFIAYSAMAVLFSLSAIISKKNFIGYNNRIATWLRISWIFLGLGILSGSIWAYRALGWGGYWAWDPIENAALVPWLIICGFLHYQACSQNLICVLPFSISCFGVFLARSGILKDQSAHAYSEGNVIVTGIVICFMLGTLLFYILKICKRKRKEHTGRPSLSNMKKIIFYFMSGYAVLIFIGTIAPIILNMETPITYYTAISAVFALAYSILLLLRDIEWLKKRSVLMVFISTMLVIGIMALTGSNKFIWLMLIWICLMPLSLWLASGFPKSWKFYLPHLGVLLLIVGAIGSSSLCGKAVAVTTLDSSQVIVAGIEIPLSELSKKDILIKSLPTQDLIIQCSQISTLPQGGFLIPYEIKPLIILFWIGGITVISTSLSFIIWDRFTIRQ